MLEDDVNSQVAPERCGVSYAARILYLATPDNIRQVWVQGKRVLARP